MYNHFAKHHPDIRVENKTDMAIRISEEDDVLSTSSDVVDPTMVSIFCGAMILVSNKGTVFFNLLFSCSTVKVAVSRINQLL